GCDSGTSAKFAPCLTVKLCPPMVSVPLRDVAFGLGGMLKVTAPGPTPLALNEIVAKPVLLTTDQPQPSGICTSTLTAPPLAVSATDDCDSVALHTAVGLF